MHFPIHFVTRTSLDLADRRIFGTFSMPSFHEVLIDMHPYTSRLELNDFACFVATKHTKWMKCLLRDNEKWNIVEQLVRIL